MSDNAYFSPSTLSFFPENMVEDGTFSEEGGNLPPDAILLTEEQTATYWKTNPPDGKYLGSDGSLPVWKDIPVKPDFELYRDEVLLLASEYNSDITSLSLKYAKASLVDGLTEQTKKTAIYNEYTARKLTYQTDLAALKTKYGN